MEPFDYVRALRRRWLIVVAACLLAGIAAWLSTPSPEAMSEERFYTATHTLYSDPVAGANPEVSLETMALLATVGEIPRRVVDELGLEEQPAVVMADVDVAADRALGTLTVTARDRDGEGAARLANTLADEILAYLDQRHDARVSDELRRLTQRRFDFEEEIRRLDEQVTAAGGNSGEATAEPVEAQLLRSERDALIRQHGLIVEQIRQLEGRQLAGSGLVTLEAAVPVPTVEGGFQAPTDPTGRTLLGILVGLVLGAGLALVVDRIDSRLRTRRDAEAAFPWPVITEVPRFPARRGERPLITADQPASFAAEAYRILRLSLQMTPRRSVSGNGAGVDHAADGTVAAPQQAQVVLVTSAGPAEGKSTTVANVAVSFAEIGKQVVVLDLDFRNAQQHHIFGTRRGPGLAEYLETSGSGLRPSLDELTQASSVPGVRVVANGARRDNPGELVRPEQDLVAEARRLADVVIIDAGPVLAVNDPGALMPHADAVVVSSRSGGTDREAAVRASVVLERMGAPVAGVVLVDVARGDAGQPYYAKGRSAPRLTRRRAGALLRSVPPPAERQRR